MVGTSLLITRRVLSHARDRRTKRQAFVTIAFNLVHRIAVCIDLEGRVRAGPGPGYCSTIAMRKYRDAQFLFDICCEAECISKFAL